MTREDYYRRSEALADAENVIRELESAEQMLEWASVGGAFTTAAFEYGKYGPRTRKEINLDQEAIAAIKAEAVRIYTVRVSDLQAKLAALPPPTEPSHAE